MTKICYKCKIEKNVEEFWKSTRKKGYDSQCKNCRKEHRKEEKKEYGKKYREKNKQRKKQWSKEYKEKNKKKIATQSKEYYKKNKEKEDLYRKNYRNIKENKNRKKELNKKYREINKEKIVKYRKEYVLKNKEYFNNYNKNRCKTDINFRLMGCLRARLNSAIKNNTKKGSAVRDLGCSIEEFKKYIESLFQSGMTWACWGIGEGKFHLDHIIPLSSFNLTNREEFLKACHYTNMQPLWEADNLSKGSKLYYEIPNKNK